MFSKKLKSSRYFLIAATLVLGVAIYSSAALAVDSNISGNLTVTGGITAAGQGVCLQNGTNCVSTSGFVPKDAWWGSTYYGSNGDIYLGYWSTWLSTKLSDLTNGYANSAGSATNATNATNATYGRYVYNNGAYSGSGWIEPSDLGVRYAASTGTASYSYLLYDAYRGGMHYSNDLYVSYAYNAGYANSAGSATNATNASYATSTYGGSNFSTWPTYAVSAGSAPANGGTASNSYLLYDAYRGGMRYSNDLYVSYAYNAGSAPANGGNADTVGGLSASQLGKGSLSCQTLSISGAGQVNCPYGYTMTGGGSIWRSDGNDAYVYNFPNGNGWYCQDNDGPQNSCYARCCLIN